MLNKSRKLRKNLTEAEKKLWSKIRKRQINGLKFRRQQPLGKYIVDFICFEKKIIIEVDGGQHLEQTNYEITRSEWLEKQGFKVIRFWNNEILNNINSVLEKIDELTE